MRRSLLLLSVVLSLAGCSGADESGGSNTNSYGGDGGGGSGNTPPPTGGPAVGMSISQVALYQGVKVPLIDAGGEVQTRNAPVVLGRDAMLRVFFETKADWEPHKITVRLTVTSGGSQTVSEFTGEPAGTTSEDKLNTSANFPIPGNLLSGDASFRVELFETANSTRQGSSEGTRAPATGDTLFQEQSSGGPLRVVVIPIRYDADGSGRLPDTSDEAIEQYRKFMYKVYPTAEVQMVVGQQLNWSQKVTGNGSGWQQLLNEMVKRRKNDGVDKDVYYYGLFMPTASGASFCQSGCVAGLTYMSPDTNDTSLRTSIGLAFPNLDRENTMAHEIGHAHQRLHAPCAINDTSSIDKAFPDKSGKLSNWGYDLFDNKLYPPTKTADFMGYCTPTWVSDYTFDALFKRNQYVHQTAEIKPGPNGFGRWQSASLDMDGNLDWGDVTEVVGQPQGERRLAELLDEDGHVLQTVKGVFTPLSHLPGGRLLLPEGTPRAASIRLEDGKRFSLRH